MGEEWEGIDGDGDQEESIDGDGDQETRMIEFYFFIHLRIICLIVIYCGN